MNEEREEQKFGELIFNLLHQLERTMAINTDALKAAIEALKAKAALSDSLQTQLDAANATIATLSATDQAQVDALTTEATAPVAPPTA
jgi:hypothetical protein